MNYEAESPQREINILTSITVNGQEYPVPDHLQDCNEVENVSGVIRVNGYRLDLATGEFVRDSKPMPYFWGVAFVLIAIYLYFNATR